jgi:hypothetical protein
MARSRKGPWAIKVAAIAGAVYVAIEYARHKSLTTGKGS